MADYTQSKSTIIAHQSVTNPNSVEGSAVDIRTAIDALIVMRHAYIEAADPGGVEPKFHILASLDQTASPPDESWFHLLTFKAVDPGAAPATEAMTATEPIAETVLAVASTTGFVAGDQIYVQDAGTEADSEWHLVDRIVSNTSIDIFMGLTAAKDNLDVIWGSAETFHYAVPGNVGHLIVHYSNEGSSAPNSAVLVEVLVNTDLE